MKASPANADVSVQLRPLTYTYSSRVIIARPLNSCFPAIDVRPRIVMAPVGMCVT